MRGKFVLAALALMATASIWQPAAAGTVSVTLRISTVSYELEDVSCALAVAPGADGVDVLRAGVAAGCIEGFTLERFGLGNFVQCIDDGINGNRCGDPYPTFLRYWTMRENCAPTNYGVDDFEANPGDELSFSYETVATLLVPACVT